MWRVISGDDGGGDGGGDGGDGGDERLSWVMTMMMLEEDYSAFDEVREQEEWN